MKVTLADLSSSMNKGETMKKKKYDYYVDPAQQAQYVKTRKKFIVGVFLFIIGILLIIPCVICIALGYVFIGIACLFSAIALLIIGWVLMGCPGLSYM
ncbi:MAG: hypothetical protein IJX05_04615 [Clostridia bacterium]|nr:hypothetical protein [Clostridia bacterium]